MELMGKILLIGYRHRISKRTSLNIRKILTEEYLKDEYSIGLNTLIWIDGAYGTFRVKRALKRLKLKKQGTIAKTYIFRKKIFRPKWDPCEE